MPWPRILLWFLGAGAVLAVAAVFTNHPILQQFGLALMIIACGVVILCSLRAIMLGSPNAAIFFFAWLSLHVSGILSGAAYIGLLSWEPLFTTVPRLGLFVEAMLLAFGLARRINLAQREKEDAQRKLVEQERAVALTLEKRVADLEEALVVLPAYAPEVDEVVLAGRVVAQTKRCGGPHDYQYSAGAPPWGRGASP